MTNGIAFALLSLFFAGLNDVVFKRYSAKDRSRGMVIFGIGLVWVILQGLTFIVSGADLQSDNMTLIYGLLAGVVLTLSNLMLIESLGHIEVSLGSTIYRLNTIGVVLLSVLFLHEELSTTKVAGITIGIVAILLLAKRPGAGKINSLPGLFLLLVIFASLLRAIYGVISKDGLSQGADADTMLLMAASCWVVGGALYARFREGRFRLTRKKTAYAFLSGLLVYLIVNFLIAAVARGEASIVIPVANLSFVAALLISVLLGMERLSVYKLGAMACAITSIGLLALSQTSA